MKKTIQFLLLIVMMTCNGVMSGQSLSSALKSYVMLNGGVESFRNEQMRNGLTALTQNNGSMPEGYTAESLVNAYMDDQIVDDYISILVPYIIDEGVSASQITELNTFLKTPEAQVAVANAQKMGSVEVLSDMIAVIQRDMIEIITSGKINEVKVNASEERQRLFHGYYNQSGIEGLIPPLIKANLGENVDEGIVQKINTYLEQNMEPLLLMAAEGILTDHDLQIWTQLTEFPQYGKIIAGSARAVSDPQQLGMALITKYLEWVKTL